MDFDRWKGIVGRLEQAAQPDKLGYEPQDGVGGERHGSMEVMYCQRADKPVMTRYTSFAITEVEREFLASIGGGADSSDFFHVFVGEILNYDSLDELEADIEITLAQRLKQTMGRANRLVVSDLRTPYQANS